MHSYIFPQADTLKLIYNLEALSARVMPVRQDSTDKQTQQNLAQHITSDNGLNFFYNILAVDKVTLFCFVVFLKAQCAMDSGWLVATPM